MDADVQSDQDPDNANMYSIGIPAGVNRLTKFKCFKFLAMPMKVEK